MSYKSILVQFSNIAHAERVLETAVGLAKRQKAFLIGLYVVPPIVMPSPVVAEAWTVLFDVERKRQIENGEKIQKMFKKACKSARLKSEWHSAEASTSAADVVIKHSFCVDIVVMIQADPDSEDSSLQSDLVERVMLESGRPVMIVPYAGHFKSVGENVLIAWQPSREAARATFGTLPLLRDAKQVKILTINAKTKNDEEESAGANQLAEALKRHGIKVDVSQTTSGRLSVSDELLSRASDYGADLIVMGGYGHSRFREVVFGGVTREILQTMTVPVLMSH